MVSPSSIDKYHGRFKICSRCDKRKQLKSFPKQILKGKYYYKPYCCACSSKRHRANQPKVIRKIVQESKRRYRQKQLQMKYDLMIAIGQTTCIQCGFSDIRALTFHHKEAHAKSFNISYGFTHSYSFETLLEEVKKCEVLCHNCHVIMHCKLIPLLHSPHELPRDMVS